MQYIAVQSAGGLTNLKLSSRVEMVFQHSIAVFSVVYKQLREAVASFGVDDAKMSCIITCGGGCPVAFTR